MVLLNRQDPLSQVTRCKVSKSSFSRLTGTEASYRQIDTQQLKSSIRLSEIAQQHTKLRRSGKTMIGLCPFHDERTPSFVITDSLGLYYCHGCQAGGDIIDYVKAINGCGFLEAIEWLTGMTAHSPLVDRPEAQRLEKADRAMSVAYARSQWKVGLPIAGTPAETYLRDRGITRSIPGTLRFGHPPLWIDNRTGKTGSTCPALVAACQDVDGRVVGVQRIFLTDEGGVAPLAKPKLSLGQIKGGALRLGPEASEIIICEGVEDGLTLLQLFPQSTVWVALGAGNMASVMLPPCTRGVVLAGDNNGPGRCAVEKAREAFEAKHIEVAAIFPAPAYEDFNDQLRGLRLEATV